MVLNDPLANVLSGMLNHEKVNKKVFVTRSNSKLIRRVLDLMRDNGYVGAYEVIEDGRGGTLKINLIGKLNKAGVIKPRYQVTFTDFSRVENQYLPARGFGLLVVSTNQGIMTNDEAREKEIGGRLIAYCY
jgi:small subunit ribosomal protein S8